MMKFPIRTILLLLSLTVIILLMTYYGNSDQPEVEKKIASIGYLNHSDTARYIGMDQCKLCHQDIYNSFMETGMGKSFNKGSKQNSAAKFDKHSVIYDKFSDFYYQPYWKGDSMKILEFRLKGKDTIYKRIETVDYIIDLGPEGGDGGGMVVVAGTPSQVAACAQSYTGMYLKR